MDQRTGKLNVSPGQIVILVSYSLASGYLLATHRQDYPDLHIMLDTGMFLLSGVLALLFLDLGARIDRLFPRLVAITFSVTCLLELLHALVGVEWSGPLAWISQAAEVLRPASWPPAAHLLPIGIAGSISLMRRKRRSPSIGFAVALIVLAAALLAVFRWLPLYVNPGWLGIARPALVVLPVIWALVALACWRLRAEDRVLSALAVMAAVLLSANVFMLFSRAPHDILAMVAHLGKVCGYLMLLLSMMQMASVDMLERIRAERKLAQLNQELEVRVIDRTARLEAANQSLEAEVNERNLAEASLRESQERTIAIIETALDGVITMNHEARIVEFNPAAENIFGYSKGDVTGRILGDVIIPESLREQHARGLAHYLATGEGPVLGKRIEMTGLRADGSEIPIELSITRMPETGKPVFTGFVRDITYRRLAEEKVQAQLTRLELLHRITRAIGERQDLRSIFQVVVRSLEDHLPLDFSCVCLYDPATETLTVTSVGVGSSELATELAMTEQARIDIDQNGLSRCVRGQLVYEPDLNQAAFPFPQRLARGGLRSLVVAPLLVESSVFGVLVAARRAVHSFSSAECEFLKQLSEHVALAVHQGQLYGALHQAYDDLRQTQQTVMQQERPRALGQMASGIAHDINNALSPAALYTESLLEKEPNLSARGREYLQTIQRAIALRPSGRVDHSGERTLTRSNRPLRPSTMYIFRRAS